MQTNAVAHRQRNHGPRFSAPNLALAVGLPLVVDAAFFLVLSQLIAAVYLGSAIVVSVASYVISSGIGFFFLRRAFRFSASVLAIFYFPLMVFALFQLNLLLAGMFHVPLE